ncbi:MULTISPECIES: HNH endonuclease [Micrococcaceae]|nr:MULTISPECIES: HNH endonuclease [Micrococcaceae]TAP26011.1 HNH endonuclease [Arthrobacter sp. S41]UXN31932.1 HNH endonuclease [Glutamicibacter sp. M10]
MRTLVLNAGYEPLAVVTFRRALVMVMADKATIVLQDDDSPVRSSHGQLPRPTVIVLKRYVRRPYRDMLHVTRRGVLRRDAFTCAYCGKSANTIDHVIPRSRGGKNTWENLVAACLLCNSRKADKMLSQLGWQLRTTPHRPRMGGHLVSGLQHIDAAWDEFLQAS